MPKRVPTFGSKPSDSGLAYEKTDERKADKAFYQSPEWIALRDAYRASNPRCACGCGGRTEHVHHKRERKVFPELALEWSNLQGLTQRCHNRKRGYPGKIR